MKPKKATKKAVKEPETPKRVATVPVSKSRSTTPKPPKAKAIREKGLTVPPILLEGDHPSTSGAKGPGHKFALGPASAQPVTFYEEAGELPEAYGTGSLLLTARDPHWVYAHWDFDKEQLQKLNTLSRDGHLILRVYLDAVRGEPHTEVHVHPESRNWFVHVGRAGARFVAEIGFYNREGRWKSVSISRPTLTPPDKLSEDISVHFETIPVDVPFEQLLFALKNAAQEHLPLAQAIQHLRESGHAGLPDFEAVASSEWTAQQEAAMAEVITMDQVRRVWMGSLEITELLRRQLSRQISSAESAAFSLPSSISVGSLSSPFGNLPREKGFWFNVNAELIIYGATDPGATVTIGEREIKLRQDGTFSYRFSLPDGRYSLPVVATSADGDDSRQAALEFSRMTGYRGDVGQHPQDEKLRPPRPENLS